MSSSPAPDTIVTAGAGMRPRVATVSGQRLRPLVGPALLLFIWWITAKYNLIGGGILASPREVLDSFNTWIFGKQSEFAWWSGTWVEYVLLSTKRMAIGFALAAGVGVTLGLLIAWYRPVREIVDPLVQLLRPIPIIAWFPLTVAIFGITESASVFLVALGGVFPITIYTADGAMHTPTNLLRAALMLGTPRHKLLFKIVLPWTLPAIFSGLRVALGLGWVLVVVSEMLAVRGGIGYVLWSAYNFNRMDLVFAVMITMGLLGFTSDALLVAVRNRVLVWKAGT